MHAIIDTLNFDHRPEKTLFEAVKVLPENDPRISEFYLEKAFLSFIS